MIDRKKVIKGLEICSEHGAWHGCDCELNGAYKYCPYHGCETGCVVTIAKDALTILKEQDASEWVSVKDRLPPMYHIVLITGNDSAGKSFGVIKGSCDGDEGQWYRDDIGQYVNSRGDAVTHWMPLPEPPKEAQ